METPKVTKRISTQNSTLSQVRQNCFRDQPFYPDDSGLGSSPATGTPRDVQSETMPDVRYRRKVGQCSPKNSSGRAVQEISDTQRFVSQNKRGNGWKKFWVIWISLLTLSSSLVAIAWVYFPNNRVVQKSQEYFMIGLMENTYPTWSENERNQYFGFNHFTDNVMEKRPNNMSFSGSYMSDELPSYSSPNTGSPNVIGQPQIGNESPGQKWENIGQTLHLNQMSRFSNSANGLPVENTNISTNHDFGNINGQEGQIKTDSNVNSRSIGMDLVRGNSHSTSKYPARRTFSGTNTDVWNEFIQYFENLSGLNGWYGEKSRRVLLSTLKGQAETYAYGMPLVIQRDYERLKKKMEERFGHTALKERYVTEAKLRKRQTGESLRDFGQAIEDFFRRAYPDNPEIVEENSIKYFLDKCGQSEDFRLAVKRTRPTSLQEAVLCAMHEECLRADEKDLAKDLKPLQRQVYEVEVEETPSIRETEADIGDLLRKGFTEEQLKSYGNGAIFDQRNDDEWSQVRPYQRNTVRGTARNDDEWSRVRPYQRYAVRDRGRPPELGNRLQNFRVNEGTRRGF